jgi:toxin-antitoxin system PIN domain toxin
MTRALLDVNVLVALLDIDHVHHARARAWLESHAAEGWASCAITQLGYVRVVSHPSYPSPEPIARAWEDLAHATASPYHQYWPCDLPPLDPAWIDPARIQGPNQLTDAYLLALAASRGGRFATFDRRVAASAVRDSAGVLEIL